MREFIIKFGRYIIFALAILLILAGSAYKNHLINDISMQHPDKRWSGGDIPSGYVAAYFGEKESVTEDTVRGYKESYENALKQDSFETPENSRLYAEAYSTEGKLGIAKELGGSEVNVNVTAVGGDFFQIHSMQLLYGNYINGTDIMKDGVILDENAAWNLYGSANIVGKYIFINNEPYYITGVVKLHDSKAAKKTYGSRSRIFMHFSSFLKIKKEAVVTCYEVLYPDVINNYAFNQVKEVLGIQSGAGEGENNAADEREVEVVNMSTRFNIPSLWKVLKSYGERSIKNNAIKYPYWENECRRTEDFASLVLIWNTLFGIVALAAIVPKCVIFVRAARERILKAVKKCIRRRF